MNYDPSKVHSGMSGGACPACQALRQLDLFKLHEIEEMHALELKAVAEHEKQEKSK